MNDCLKNFGGLRVAPEVNLRMSPVRFDDVYSNCAAGVKMPQLV